MPLYIQVLTKTAFQNRNYLDFYAYIILSRKFKTNEWKNWSIFLLWTKKSKIIGENSEKTLHYLLLFTVCNMCLMSGDFPNVFKKALTHSIHKGGNKRDVNNCSPISVVTFMSEVLEKILNVRSTEDGVMKLMDMDYCTKNRQKLSSTIRKHSILFIYLYCYIK